MNLFDFLCWCFSDSDHGACTVLVGWMLFSGVTSVVRACRGGDE